MRKIIKQIYDSNNNLDIEKMLNDLNFAHLHNHDEYSIRDGFMSQQSYINRGKEIGAYAIAETNHGKMYGIYSFYKNCMATQDKNKKPLTPIKPILGVEAYVTPSLDYIRSTKRGHKKYFHLILLAKNYEGYIELCKSTRKSEKQTFAGKPILTHANIQEFFTTDGYTNGNIIISSACLGGEIQVYLDNGEIDKAEEIATFYHKLFGDDFYIELQNHGLSKQTEIIKKQVDLAKKLGIETIITSDAHFARRTDKKNHDILMCLQWNKKLYEYDNNAYTEHHYVKTKYELFSDFRGIIDDIEIIRALKNTGDIADKCNIVFPKENHYPKYPNLKNGETADDLLKKKSYTGLKTNITGFDAFSEEKQEEYKKRLDFELDVIKKTGYSDYFLNVSDILMANDNNGAYSGLGRGSVVGSLVSSAIGITKVDPIKYGLFFDRFLNLERVSPPDADLDFDDKREEVFSWTVNTYGWEKVCKVITFGKYGGRGAIRAIGRVLDLKLAYVDTIAKAFPEVPGLKFKDALTKYNNKGEENDKFSQEFKNIYDNDIKARELIDRAIDFEGVIDHTGIHAAACIIGDKDLTEYIPLQWDDKTNMWVSQFYKDYNEELGLLKMDYLGLNNLTIFKETARLIKQRHNIDLKHKDIIDLALKDKEIIKEIYSKGNTINVFQFESEGLRKVLTRFNPETIEDLILLNAVYRPGPMQYIDAIIENKKHPEKIVYDHECLRPILEETYGKPVYQEQVMSIFRVICGYSLGQADIIRRAMGKKHMDELKGAKKDFIEGYVKLGLTKERGEKFFKELMDFASYAFNKSHAAAYTITSLESAFLKHKYPLEYMTACLSCVTNNKAYNKVLEECKKMGMEILLPSINKSEELFSAEGNNKIRFGLSCIKGVGKAAKEIIQKRPYTSYQDFIVKHSNSKDVSTNKVQALAYAGAFDELGITRSTAFYNVELLNHNKKGKKNVNEGQIDFFSTGIISNEETIKLTEKREMNYLFKLEKEQEVLYAYISGHPLDPYKQQCIEISEKKFVDFSEEDNNQEYTVVARIKDLKILYRKKDQKPMAKLILEDLTTSVDAIVFTKEYEKNCSILKKGKTLIFKVKVTVDTEIVDEEEVKNIQVFVKKIEELTVKNRIFIKIKNKSNIKEINKMLRSNKGGTQVYLYVEEDKELIKTEYFIELNQNINNYFKLENIS